MSRPSFPRRAGNRTRVLSRVRAHAEREGRKDYLGRAHDVIYLGEPEEWATPYAGADEAYLNAVGTGEICRELRLPPEAWDEIAEEWCRAFRDGYEGALAAAVRS